MSTPDTNNIGIKLQSAGENLNTWGDPNLNNDLIVLSNLSSKWNPLTINGDTTITEANYATTNNSEVATLKLVAGTVAGAFNLILPGRAKRLLVWNTAGFAATIKLSATTGFTLPSSRWTWIATDGATDVYNLGSNYVGTGYTITNAGDVANKSYVDTAIATAALPATAGTILIDGADTTAGYPATKITGSGAVAISITSAGGNEKLNIAVGALALTVGAKISAAGITAAVNTRYQVDKTTAYTITLPAAPAQGDVVQFEAYGTALTTFALNGLKYYASTTNPTTSGQGIQTFIYTVAATGWIDA